MGPQHPDTALSLNNLAVLYRKQGKYEQAEPLYVRALAIREQQLGPLHPDTASSLNNLAAPLLAQGKYEQAEPLLVRALAICEQQLGPEHPDTAKASITWPNSTVSRASTSRPSRCTSVPWRSGSSSWGQSILIQPPASTTWLDSTMQGNYEQAEPLYLRALAIREQQLGPLHPPTQIIRGNYIALLRTMGRDAEARVFETKHMPPS